MITKNFSRGLALSLLAVIYPVIFLYSYNAKIVNIGSLWYPLISSLLIGGVVFGLFLALMRNAARASLSTVIFMIFFYSYGPVYDKLLAVNKIQIEHFTFLPAYLTLGVYVSALTGLLKNKFAVQGQKILLGLAGILIAYNVIMIVPSEIQKAQVNRENSTAVAAKATPAKKSPDIYFIIFDEYAGFDAIKEYWHDTYVDGFETFLEQKGFFVANHSESEKLVDSLIEISDRLNIRHNGDVAFGKLAYFELIRDNKVMRILKEQGYTTVVFNGLKLGYPTLDSIPADVYYSPDDVAHSTSQQSGLMIDEFWQMVLDKTMIRPISNLLNVNDPWLFKFQNMLFFSKERVKNLQDIQSPKFVYAHFLFPHTPFMFNEDGMPVSPNHKFDWNYYLGQHKYATKLAKEIVTSLIDQADPANPPIIVLQSDHGARMIKVDNPDAVILTDYPNQYKTHIMNALYLPGYDTSTLTEDMKPYLTFQLIFKHYFDLDIPVEEGSKK
jgi:hypothetical protein